MMNGIPFVCLNDEEAEACYCKRLGDGTLICMVPPGWF